MAQGSNKKKGTAQGRANGKAAARATKAAPSRSSGGRKAAGAVGGMSAAERAEKRARNRSLRAQITPYLLIVGAVLLVICFINGRGQDPGIVTGFIYRFLTGLFGGSAFAAPAFLIFAAVVGLCDRSEDIIGWRCAFAGISVLMVSALLEVISPLGSYRIAEMYARGSQLHGGGAVGGIVGEFFLMCFRIAGSYVLIIALLLLSVLLCAGLTPKYIFVYLKDRFGEARQRRLEEKEYLESEAARNAEDYDAQYPQDVPPAAAAGAAGRRRTRINAPAAAEDRDANRPYVDPETGEVHGFVPPELFHEEAAVRRAKFDTDVPLDPEPMDGDETADTVFAEDERDSAIFSEVMNRSRQTKSKAELDAENALFDDDGGNAGYAGSEPGTDEIISPIMPDSPSEKEPEGADIIDRRADRLLSENEDSTGSEPAADTELSVKRRHRSEIPAQASQVPLDIPKPEYSFPPAELLAKEEHRRDDNVREELQEKAAKLVSVLSSFNVKTKIVGVSRGPTITRYELLPEAGTRVRSIANLVDDIALNLATTGVRIEAPIPGKAAVGIEVPNKTPETVYLRSLIESPDFTGSGSRIAACLGKKVGGEPVIMDIKKMPHLLIAGATGMGKSVCINSILVSFLYKARPDEVKLILIDPKKVEFSIYNGLPHLLVPVVSDPKKAAGSLSWAVNEMERRFGIIETVGVRDIAAYNDITKDDPEYDFMPQIVIVIDELADLMSTAPDDVETSIARLAAKARAAGMHLIIGTQRPSVNVITGVIKANIPSRIAFTVASQVDSRTIIDRSGAENLIGRGDMLYNPVGAAKPVRVQGAFVSDKEVDAVVTYIKEHNSPDADTSYSSDVMKQIDEAAAMCGVKKGAGAAQEGAIGHDSGDPLMDQALEVAFESGKISTSLLQRRLSVGYGRAAKLIDKMEQLGYVSAPDGQKPRELLITKQDYMEIAMKKDDGEQ